MIFDKFNSSSCHSVLRAGVCGLGLPTSGCLALTNMSRTDDFPSEEHVLENKLAGVVYPSGIPSFSSLMEP